MKLARLIKMYLREMYSRVRVGVQACPQVVDGGHGLQMCKVAANIWNK